MNNTVTVKLGKTYRAKNPKQLIETNTADDRTIVWMDDKHVSFICGNQNFGESSRPIPIAKFIDWAAREVPMHPRMMRHWQMLRSRQVDWNDYASWM